MKEKKEQKSIYKCNKINETEVSGKTVSELFRSYYTFLEK